MKGNRNVRDMLTGIADVVRECDEVEKIKDRSMVQQIGSQRWDPGFESSC